MFHNNMKNIIICAGLVAYSLAISEAAKSDEIFPKFSMNDEEPSKNLTLLKKWESLEKILKDVAREAVKKLLPIVIENSEKMNLSRQCMTDSMHLILGLRNIKTWALRFLDSSSKSIDGLMYGTLSSFGSYTECVDTEVKSTRLQDKGKLLYRGQYCLVGVKPSLPPQPKKMNLHFVLPELKAFFERDTVIAEFAKEAHLTYFFPLQMGVCIPSGCSKEDLTKVVKSVASPLYMNAIVSRCEVKEENKFTPIIKAVIACYSLAGFLMLVGTSIDIYVYYTKAVFKNTLIRVLMAFSFMTNFKKFINTNTQYESLSCLNGIRFLSISWIIASHTYLMLNFEMLHGVKKAQDITSNFAFQAIVNGSFAVDTFFFISGLLVCYLTIKTVRKGRKLNIGFYIFHRLWRILPTYAFVIMFVFLLNMLGSGPTWHNTTYKYIKGCYNNWWTNLIFINNFYKSNDMCLNHSWYLSADFQLYLAALLVLIPMIRWPKIAISLAFLVIIASVLYAGIVTYVNDFPPTMLASPDFGSLTDYWIAVYFKPFLHSGPYCIGLLAGYLLATKPDLKISRFFQVLGWSLAFIFNFSTLYGVHAWNNGVEPTYLPSILYSSLSRTAWALGVAWMVICCATGHGGVVNYILTWKIFVPLGRLTYLAYLIHPLVQVCVTGNLKTTIQFDHFLTVWLFFGHLCATYGISFAGTMLIEGPFMALEKIFLPRGDKRVESDPMVIENNVLNGGLKLDKSNDISLIVPMTEKRGIDNRIFVYKL